MGHVSGVAITYYKGVRSRRSTRSGGCVLFFVLILAVGVATEALAPSGFLSLGVAWTRPLPSPLVAPPTIGAGVVYLPLRNGQLVAVSLASGEPLWQVAVPAEQALALGENRLFAATKTELVAIDTHDGSTPWRAELVEPSAPPAWRAGWVVAGRGDGTLVAFRASDGRLMWQHPLGAPLAHRVTIDGDRVFAPLRDGSLVALDILQGAVVWRDTLPGAAGPITVANDRLYLGCTDNFLYSYDYDDGDRRWRWRTGADVVGRAAVDADRVYFVSLDNVLRALDAHSGVQRWKHALDARPSGGPLLLGDLLVMGGVGAQVSVIRAANGTLAGRWTAPAELAQPPVLVSDSASRIRAIVVTGASVGGWRLHGLGPSLEPAPGPLREIPGRTLPPDPPPSPRRAPPPGA
jgi:outer membrane protein assembly factor BamB